MIFGLSKANQAQIRKARVHAARAKQIEQYKQSRAGTRAKQANQSKQSGQVTIKLSKVKQASKQSRTQIAKQSCSQPVSQRAAEQTYIATAKTKDYDTPLPRICPREEGTKEGILKVVLNWLKIGYV